MPAKTKTPTIDELIAQRSASDAAIREMEAAPLREAIEALADPAITALKEKLTALQSATAGENRTQLGNVVTVLDSVAQYLGAVTAPAPQA